MENKDKCKPADRWCALSANSSWTPFQILQSEELSNTAKEICYDMNVRVVTHHCQQHTGFWYMHIQNFSTGLSVQTWLSPKRNHNLFSLQEKWLRSYWAELPPQTKLTAQNTFSYHFFSKDLCRCTLGRCEQQNFWLFQFHQAIQGPLLLSLVINWSAHLDVHMLLESVVFRVAFTDYMS